MAKLLFFFMLISFPSFAEDVADSSQSESMEIIKEVKDLPSALMQKTTPEPEAEILYTVEKKLIPLPSCDSPELLARAKEHITAFLEQATTNSTLFRRRRHFILKSLNTFTPENIADYQTSTKSPVSDIIADLRMNEGILVENMRLCKSENLNADERPIFLLIWPKEKKYQVRVINLSGKSHVDIKTSFVYEEQS